MQRKDLIQLGAAGVLVIALIVALGNAFKKAPVKAPERAGALPNPAQKIESGNLYNLLEQEACLLELKRDPFTAAPIVSEKTLQSGVDLTGILWDKDKPLAIIGGVIVKKGSRVGAKTVVEIKQDRVILSDEAVLSELRLE